MGDAGGTGVVMLAVLSESWQVLGRMRWFLLAAMIALPLNQIPSAIARHSFRKQMEKQQPSGSQRPPATKTLTTAREWRLAVRDGVADATSLYQNMLLGKAVWLAAGLVLLRPGGVWRWLRERAGLRRGRGVIFGFLLAGAAVTVLTPVLQAGQMLLVKLFDHGRGASVVLIGLCVLWMLAAWFGACLMAFLQSALYPLLARAWAGQSCHAADMLDAPATGWARLVRFNFWVGILGGVLMFGPSLLPGFRRFRELFDSPERLLGFLVTLGWLTVVLFLVVVFVPFAVVMRGLRLGRAIRLSTLTVIRRSWPLIGLLLPLAGLFAAFNMARQFLRAGGDSSVLTGMGSILLWIPVAFVATVGLVAGAGLFDRLLPVSSPDTRS
jgi:hypothetical protein